MYEMDDTLPSQILTNVLNNTDPRVDTREGSPTYTLQAPNADEFANVYAEFQATKEEVFIINDEGEVTMAGARLDAWVNIFGMERKAGGRASGQVTLTAAEPTLVPAGTQVFAPATLNILFETIEDATATPSGVTVGVISVYAGADSNVASGSITGVVGDLEGIITVTNPAETAGGFDEESDEELVARYFNYMRKPAASGNANDYYRWATETAGISDALVIPVWNGPGTVKVILLSNDHRAPAPEVIAEATHYIEENRPIDANQITVEGAVEIPINIAADVTVTGGIEAVKAEYTLQLIEHFKTLQFEKGDLVRVTRTQNFLLDIPEVQDFQNFTLNGGAANIAIPPGSVAVLGTVTLNEVV